MKRLVTERDVIDAWRKRQREILIPQDALVTPAAAEAARVREIRIDVQSPQQYSHSQLSASTKVDPSSGRKIFIGSDHGGFELKEILKTFLEEGRFDVEDVGTYSKESVDYPDFACKVALGVSKLTGAFGVIIDGAGVGSAMSANKVPGIRAATCHDVYTARNSRAHNNANVLTLGSRVLGVDVAKGILTVWLETPFEGGRHQTRVDKIMEIEKKYRD